MSLTPPGGTSEFGSEWEPWLDPPNCPACRQSLEPGYMVCPTCGSYVLRTSYPMSGPWNRRFEGTAVSGWDLPFSTGTQVSVTMSPAGVSVSSTGIPDSSWRWSAVADMDVVGPGTQSRVGLDMLPVLNLADPSSAAAMLGISYLVRKGTTQTMTETFFALVTETACLVVRNTEIDRQALRWLLEPAFTTLRIELARQQRLIAEGRWEELDGSPPES